MQAFDKVSNTASASLSVTRDSDAPAVHINQPADGARLNAQTIAVSGTVDQEAGLTLTVNGVAATITGGTFSAAAVPLVEGNNTLTARVTDSVGNQGTHTRVVVRDTVAPKLDSADPASGALALPVDAIFRLTFSEDIAEPAAGSWRLETGTSQAIPATANRAGNVLTVRPSVPLPSSSQVRLVLTAAITDLAGNALATPPTLTFLTVDTTAPGAPALSPAPPQAVCAASITLTGTAEAGAVVRVEGAASAAEARADEAGHFSLSVQLSPGSLNRLQVTATDAGGNVSAPALAAVVHDCVAPRVVSADHQGNLFHILFSEPVTPASLAGAVQLSSASGAIAGTVSLATNGLTATFTAPGSLPAGALRLEVTTAVTDLAGNAMAYPWSQVFGASGGSGFLLGTVIDNATGRPLAGARVLVTATNGTALPEPLPEQVTGDDGRFRLPVPAGTHDLTIARTGYAPAFRLVTSGAGQGTEIFDPRLTPAAKPVTLGSGGGTWGSGADAILTLPSGALAESVAVAVTRLDEQGLPMLLPYGWSPRGAAWLDVAGAALLAESTLSLPVESANGTTLALIHLDLASLQWRVLGTAQVSAGRVTFTLPAAAAGLTDGGWAAVEADSGPLAPPAPVAGAVLGASARPAGNEATAATLTFNPEVVLPSQSSQATALYTVSQGVASGLPVTLFIEEQLTLLDNSVRNQTPYQADLVLYHAADGTPRSRFQLRPSQAAQALPLKLGAEDVTLRTYGGEAVAGNVVGAEGGTVTGDQGDRIDLPPGAVTDPTAIVLNRKTPADLGLTVPAGTELAGLVDLDLGGKTLLVPAALSLALSPAPASGDKGLLLQVVDLESGGAFRAVAALQATATGWTTSAIDPTDLAWPGVREEGLYAFVRLTAPVGYLRGTIYDLGGAALAGAVVRGSGVGWLQVSNANGTYVLPAPVATLTATAENRVTGNQGAAAVTVPAADARVDVDITLRAVGPRVVEFVPADGTVDVTQGIQPTIRFSEPVTPASITGAIQLLSDGQPVAVDFDVQGVLVRVKPKATLLPGTQHELRVTSGVTDLQGNPLDTPVAAHFTTRRILLNQDLDLSRVFLIAPDSTGQARVLGRAGAVPANATVFVENRNALVTTPTVTAGQDGGFDLSVQAALTHTLILHVLIPNSNEVVAKLTPFHTADLKGAYVSDQALTFTTGEGVTVDIAEGTFTGPTVVRLATKPVAQASLPAPDDLAPIFAFTLDFSGADASKPLQISVPFPAGAATARQGDYLLNRRVEALGNGYWMLHDLMRLDTAHGILTTEDPTGTTGNAVAQLASLSLNVLADLQPKTTTPTVKDRRKKYMPGAVLPGEYEVVAPQVDLGWPVLPSFSFDGYVAVFNSAFQGMATVINAKIDSLLGRIGVLIPTRLDRAFTLTGRDVTTGFKVFEKTFDPPLTQEIVVLPPDTYGVNYPPFPIAGSPIRFFVIDGGKQGELELDLKTKVSVTDTGLKVTGEAGAAQSKVAIRLLGLDDDFSKDETSKDDGSFTVEGTVQEGHRYLLVISAAISTDEVLKVSFSEALNNYDGIEILDSHGKLTPDIRQSGARWDLRIALPAGWRAGETYKLRFTRDLADANGKIWDKLLEIPIKVAESTKLGNFSLNRVRDMASLGSLLFVAGDEDGLIVLDASDPKNLKSYLPDVKFTFPLGDRVSGVAVDPHGRVLVAGGGIKGFGQLKIFDPLVLKPEEFSGASTPTATLLKPWKGNTLLSDKLGGSAGGDGLRGGTPGRVTVLSSDDKYEWRVSDGAPPLSGLHVSPTAPQDGSEFTLTISGSNGKKNHPVSLFDVSLGRWTRVDADDSGHFEISLKVFPDDRIRVLINTRTVAYVMTQGLGIEVVDVDAFYNEERQSSLVNIQSDVRGVYSGENDPALRICDGPVADLSAALLDFDSLFQQADPDAPDAIPLHPISLFALLGFRGFVVLESNASNPAQISYLNDECAQINGDANVSAMKLLPAYRFDFNDNGRLDDEKDHDYALVAHRKAGILIYDVTNREDIHLVGQIRLPGQAANLGIDRENRRLFVAASGGGLYLVDLNAAPSTELVDKNSDGQDDRILETIKIDGNSNSVISFLPELGLAFSGGAKVGAQGGGVTAVAFSRPTVRTVTRVEDGDGKGRYREVVRLAPFGVPTAKENDKPDTPNLTGLVQFVAELPGSLGADIHLDVEGVTPAGKAVSELGDPEVITNLPRASMTGEDDGLKLTRVSEKPWEDGYNRYVSKPVAVLADVRASHHYDRNPEEKKDGHCDRCEEKIPDDAVEMLSGNYIDVRIPTALRPKLEDFYGKERLVDVLERVQSVPWDMSPSPRQEARLNPGRGEAVPGTVLNSGEMTVSAPDLYLKGRGFDFSFVRTYRNQTVGNGVFGPAWDFNYNEHLRELPNGDVEYFDGRGRKELFKRNEGGIYVAPAGLFVGLDGGTGDLGHLSTGWVVVDAHRGTKKFDRFGRLASMADPSRDAEDTGNEMKFFYDLASHLVRIEDTLKRNINLVYNDDGLLEKIVDPEGREVDYEYDDSGRLITVTSPAINTGQSQFSNGLVTRYQYRASIGNMTQRLVQRDNLAKVTDPRGRDWLEVLYDDVDGDGRVEEVTSQIWGRGTVHLAYTFGDEGQTAVTDRRGNVTTYHFDGEGRVVSIADPLQKESHYEYGSQGQLKSVTTPNGKKTSYDFMDTDQRSRGNVSTVTIEPGSNGPNGSSGQLVRTIEYSKDTNEPVLLTEPWGTKTKLERDDKGRPTQIIQGFGSDVASTTILTYNKYGQIETVTDANHNVTTLSYYDSGDSEGYLKDLKAPEEQTTHLETDARGNVTAITDSGGVRHEQIWNEVDWLVESRAAASATGKPALNYQTFYLYDEDGNVIEKQQPAGDGTEHLSVRYQYGRLNEVEGIFRDIAAGTSVSELRFYDNNLNLIGIQGPEGRNSDFTYDERNLLKTAKRASGSPFEQTETYERDDDGQLISTTDARGKIRLTRWDGYGRLEQGVDPLEDTVETTYDNAGNLLEATSFDSDDKVLARTNFQYDALERVKLRRDWAFDPAAATEFEVPTGAQALETKYEYDLLSSLKKVTDPRGTATTFDYDTAGRLVERQDGEGNRIHLTLDPSGTAKTVTRFEAGGGTVIETLEYDALNRLTKATDGVGNATEFRYDAHGNKTFLVEPGNIVTTRQFDGLDRLLSVVRPGGVSVQYDYDLASRLTHLTDALGNRTTYEYDLLDRLSKTTYPDGKIIAHSYDLSHNTDTITTPRGFKVEKQFDELNRLTHQTVKLEDGGAVSGPLSEEYRYDGLSRLIWTQSGSIVAQRGLDSLARGLSDQVGSNVVGYQYDPSGNPKILTYPSGLSQVRRFDALNRPTVVGGLAPGSADAWYSYHGPSLVGTASFRNGLVGTYSYNAAEQPTQVSFVAGGKTDFKEDLQWSPRGFKVSESRSDQNGAGYRYVQDETGRLLSATRVSTPAQADAEKDPALRRAFATIPSRFEHTFDTAQNLLSVTASKDCDGTQVSLPLDSSGRNRPASVSGSPLEYDAAGNLTRKGDLRFEYDFRNRLIRVTATQGEIARYTYDALGRRISKTAGGRTITTVWDGWQPIEEWQDLGENGRRLVSRRTYGPGLDEIALLETDLDGDGTLETKTNPVYDESGNLVALTRPDGSVVERYIYSPFGQMWALVDDTPPAIEQLRLKNGAIWMEMSEEVSSEKLTAAVSSGSVTLVNTTKQNQVVPISVSQPIKTGRQANRRIVITLTDPVPPESGDVLRLQIAEQTLVDLFSHSAPAATFSIPWTTEDLVLSDSTPPRMEQICFSSGTLKMMFSEEVNTDLAASAITVDGAQKGWTLSQDRYTLTAQITEGAHNIHISTDGLDLKGLGLSVAFDRGVTVPPGQAMKSLFEAPDPRLTPPTTGNSFGFQGLQRDPETGFIYARNRYYDPELGRFISVDPLEYSDGPNLYGYADNNPIDSSDPLGLQALPKFNPGIELPPAANDNFRLFPRAVPDAAPGTAAAETALEEGVVEGGVVTTTTGFWATSVGAASGATVGVVGGVGLIGGVGIGYGIGKIPLVGGGDVNSWISNRLADDLEPGAGRLPENPFTPRSGSRADGKDWYPLFGVDGTVLQYLPNLSRDLAGVPQPVAETDGSPLPSAVTSVTVVTVVKPGSFSITDWTGYPDSIPKPTGPFRLLEGAEYDAARTAANRANSALHKADKSLGGWQLHEVHPVKFGGDPVGLGNKMPLPAGAHGEVTNWWNALQRLLEGGRLP
ncbi:MAG TPA: Ig-like domain-containing protein [Thermoanaerobaculia bacterium]|nr:Ig-like domain-containing protein [Thermoanaerobaculia bacterium]